MKRSGPYVLIAAMLFGAWACKKSDNSAAYQTSLSISNFVLNADSLTVLYDGNPLNGNRALSFGATTSRDSIAYLRPGAGVHDLSILVNNKLAKEKNFQAIAGKYHSLLVYDSLKSDTVKTILLEEAITVIDSVAQLRFINTIPGSDSLTLVASHDTSNYAAADVYIGLKSSPTYAFGYTLKKGSWTLRLYRGLSVIAKTDSVSFAAGRSYTIIAKGLPGGTGPKAQGLSVLRNN